jgi:hypothetical protein
VNEKTLAFPDVYTRPIVVGIDEEGKVQFEEFCIARETEYSDLLDELNKRDRNDDLKAHFTHLKGEMGE